MYLLLRTGVRLLLRAGSLLLLRPDAGYVPDPRTFDVAGGVGATFGMTGGTGASVSLAGGLGATFTAAGNEEGDEMTALNNDIAFDADEDVEIVATIPTTDDLTGWTIGFKVEGPNGSASGTGVVLSNLNKTIKLTLAANSLIAGDYRWRGKRTDTGSHKSLVGGAALVNDPVG